MTRKEIEKRCLEEMQQNIPDSEALWQRIEAQLPPQEEVSSEPSHITVHVTQMRRILTTAACLLVAVTGAALISQHSRLNTAHKSESNDAPAVQEAPMHADDEAAEKTDSPEQNASESEAPDGLRTYASLHLPDSMGSAAYTVSGTQGEYFSESAVLAKTDCFVDVQVTDVRQDAETGELIYTLSVLGTYGDTAIRVDESLNICSETAYMLEQNHLYLLPLSETAGKWSLAYECAPQIEMTLDGEAVHHNGWHSLMNDRSEPLLYEQYGEDDYFYDRMYLAQNEDIRNFLKEWEEIKNA